MTRGNVPGKKHWRSWHSILAGVLVGAAAAALPAGVGHGAARPHATPAAPAAIVLTGTSFPAGLGIDVASDPVGLQAALWSPIIGFDDKLAPYAALATRVPTLANGDARVIGGGFRVTVHLRPTLRWSDGSPLTASDVLFGLKLNLDPAIGNSFGLDEIKHIAAPDAHTVVLTFGDTYGAYLAYAMPPALPQTYFQRKYRGADIHALALAYRSDPYDSPSDVFSGPYRVAGVAPGQRLTLDPNPYYTAPSGAMGSGSRPELRSPWAAAHGPSCATSCSARMSRPWRATCARARRASTWRWA